MRCALAILFDYFSDENDCERRAWALHYALGCRITVHEGWTMTESDLNDTVLDILLSGRESEPMEIMHAERRDVLRQLACSEQVFGENTMSYRRSSNAEVALIKHIFRKRY